MKFSRFFFFSFFSFTILLHPKRFLLLSIVCASRCFLVFMFHYRPPPLCLSPTFFFFSFICHNQWVHDKQNWNKCTQNATLWTPINSAKEWEFSQVLKRKTQIKTCTNVLRYMTQLCVSFSLFSAWWNCDPHHNCHRSHWICMENRISPLARHRHEL